MRLFTLSFFHNQKTPMSASAYYLYVKLSPNVMSFIKYIDQVDAIQLYHKIDLPFMDIKY
ncbi:MAG: hypothetical protein WBM70_08525 [Sulfurovum sp.]|uniref:hypothetical protein n=1 Tax=Sulfurovum sp. TaxID=1969726 RepID=UPI003C78CCCD